MVTVLPPYRIVGGLFLFAKTGLLLVHERAALVKDWSRT